MKPILPGGRGPAVEDVQRRLLLLGHDLGPTGVDGVFLGCTRDAVASFQRERALAEDGIVGDETWSALVDATFTLGDRMLYLRLPHFHGQDVRTLQEALGALGFSCGEPDAIFGTCTERAVREFQRNSGLSADGIVGLETVRTVERLRHVWQGKAHLLHASSPAGSLPAGSGLAGVSLVFRGRGDIAWAVAGRAVNLALAHDAATEVVLDEATGHAGDVIVEVRQGRSPAGVRGPVVTLGRDEAATLPMRLAAGLEARADGEPTVTVELLDLAADDEEMQRAAVRLLDALRSALA